MVILTKIWIFVDYSRCAGCRMCEVACSLEHEGVIWPEASRIRVFEFVPGVTIPTLCYQCPDYPCVKACPNDALEVDKETGAVKVRVSRCNMSGECIEACPAKIPRIPLGKNHVVICDLCGGNPKCVEACKQAGHNALKIIEGAVQPIRKTFLEEAFSISEKLAKKMYDGLEGL